VPFVVEEHSVGTLDGDPGAHAWPAKPQVTVMRRFLERYRLAWSIPTDSPPALSATPIFERWVPPLRAPVRQSWHGDRAAQSQRGHGRPPSAGGDTGPGMLPEPRQGMTSPVIAAGDWLGPHRGTRRRITDYL
jgi:hypothetical protein